MDVLGKTNPQENNDEKRGKAMGMKSSESWAGHDEGTFGFRRRTPATTTYFTSPPLKGVRLAGSIKPYSSPPAWADPGCTIVGRPISSLDLGTFLSRPGMSNHITTMTRDNFGVGAAMEGMAQHNGLLFLLESVLAWLLWVFYGVISYGVASARSGKDSESISMALGEAPAGVLTRDFFRFKVLFTTGWSRHYM